MAGEMGLTIPTPQVTIGPEWAQNISEDLGIIESHDHLATGARLSSQGMDFIGNLELLPVSTYSDPYMGGWSAMYMSPVITDGSVSIPNLSLLVDSSTNDLYYKNLSGDIVRLTNGSSIATPPLSVEMNWPTSARNVSTTINPLDAYICYEMDVSAGSSPYTLTLPLAASVPDGHIYIVKQKPTSNSSSSANTTNNILYIDTHDATDSISCYGVTSNSNGANKRVIMPRYEAWAICIKKDATNWNVWVSSIEATANSSGVVRMTDNLSGTGLAPRVVGTSNEVELSKNDGSAYSAIRASANTGNLGIFGSENADYGGGIVISTNGQDGDPMTLVTDDDIKLVSKHSIKLVTNNSGQTEVDDDLYVGGSATVVSDVTAQGDVTCGELHVNSGLLTASGTAVTSNASTVTIVNDLSVGDDLTVGDDMTVGGGLTVGTNAISRLSVEAADTSGCYFWVGNRGLLTAHTTSSVMESELILGVRDGVVITSAISGYASGAIPTLVISFGENSRLANSANYVEFTGVEWSGVIPTGILVTVNGVARRITLGAV